MSDALGSRALIGSANMDRRSFDLNYGNNILLYDRKLTNYVLRLQAYYISQIKYCVTRIPYCFAVPDQHDFLFEFFSWRMTMLLCVVQPGG